MPFFVNTIVVNALVGMPGGTFAAIGETLNFDSNGDINAPDGATFVFEDGSEARDATGGNTAALVTATITYEGDSTLTVERLVLRTLDNGQTILYATGAQGGTSPLPRTDLLAKSIAIEAFGFDSVLCGELTAYPPLDAGEGDPPCFTKGTRILTDLGEIPVEALGIGDLVMTAGAGLQPISWIGRSSVSAARFAAYPSLQPITISAGTLGTKRDLTVSPGHRMLVSSGQTDVLVGSSKALVAARDLINDTTVRPAAVSDVTYFQILLPQHAVIFAEGAATESLHPSVDIIDKAAQTAMRLLVPELANKLTGLSRLFVRAEMAA